MTPKEKAKELSQLIRESEEYTAYRTAKEKLYSDEQSKQLLMDYKRKQFAIQASLMSGQQPTDDMMSEFQRMTMFLQYNRDVAAFLVAEHRFHQVISEIYEILTEELDLEMDFLKPSNMAN